MSGGHFEYKQHRIREIYEEIQYLLDRQGKIKDDHEFSHFDSGYYEQYSEEVQDIFNEAIATLKRAEIYTKRVDWFLSGDDGEDTFIKKLKSELNE